MDFRDHTFTTPTENVNSGGWQAVPGKARIAHD